MPIQINIYADCSQLKRHDSHVVAENIFSSVYCMKIIHMTAGCVITCQFHLNTPLLIFVKFKWTNHLSLCSLEMLRWHIIPNVWRIWIRHLFLSKILYIYMAYDTTLLFLAQYECPLSAPSSLLNWLRYRDFFMTKGTGVVRSPGWC